MKVAVSIPDRIHRAADRAAKRLRVPRSQFYARAVEAYLMQTAEDEVTERLNAVYAEEAPADDPFLTEAAKATFRRNPW
jgi:hypothetical protein